MNEVVEEIERQWAEALSNTPLRRYSVPEERQREYWNKASSRYDNDASDVGAAYSNLLNSLIERGVVRPEDRALDVGCGTGLFSIPLAKAVSSLTALDRSPAMLKALAAKTGGAMNLRTISGDWELFRPDRKFELVFSSFCPAVYSLRSMLRMEECSSRHCCIVALKDGSEPYFLHMAINRVTGDVFETTGLSLTYAKDMLTALGREWGMETASMRSSLVGPADDIYNKFLDVLSMMLPMDQEKKNALRGMIDEHTSEGIFRFTVAKQVAALHWRTPHLDGERADG